MGSKPPSQQLDATMGLQQGCTVLNVGFALGLCERVPRPADERHQLSRAALAVSGKSLKTPSTPSS